LRSRFFLYLALMNLTNAEIKLIHALSSSKGRKKHQAYMVEGIKMVEELLMSDEEILFIAARQEWFTANPEASQQYSSRLLKDRELQKLSNFSSSNQVLAVASLSKEKELHIENHELVLVLDTIQDPGNLGTIIRTADWFGIDKIVCSKETADAYNPKVVQASMGSVFRTKIFYTDLITLLQKHPDSNIYGSLLSGDNIYRLSLKNTGFIIIGNESKGISPEVQKYINQAIYIPIHKNSKAESLNAAVACSIILSEFSREI